MTAASDNLFPKLLVRESLDDGSDFSNPAADYRVLFVGEDGDIHLKDSAGSVTDFPAGGGGSVPQPWVITPIYGAARAADATIGAANRAVVVPVWVPVACTIDGVRLKIANATGNGDVGLYNSSLSRVAANGGAAWPGTGIQTINFSAGYAASAGRYYLAMAASSNTASFAVANVGGTSGPINAKFMETAYPLPTTFTSAGETAFDPAIVGIINGITY